MLVLLHAARIALRALCAVFVHSRCESPCHQVQSLSFVCCIWALNRPSFPGGPFQALAGTRARTQSTCFAVTGILQMGPEFIRGAIRCSLEKTVKFKKLLLKSMVHLG